MAEGGFTDSRKNNYNVRRYCMQLITSCFLLNNSEKKGHDICVEEYESHVGNLIK
ncbi:hypothetical protein PRUPE_8G010400 [Prunus persica]|uniref:Uncharacterized protein n=1 Tax=Prunus persica TaxID=3760 RepID=A0A251MQX3_PRUPE|nr:hypothetical protein PRUPE_8G010400 [Prunus persica]ONH89697.1 hypothetical protein PRUPE_8G010400 [Prunus persica]ONH89698.1 hypothetical protein PRUPE_8G010400 [Prunus persica]